MKILLALSAAGLVVSPLVAGINLGQSSEHKNVQLGNVQTTRLEDGSIYNNESESSSKQYSFSDIVSKDNNDGETTLNSNFYAQIDGVYVDSSSDYYSFSEESIKKDLGVDEIQKNSHSNVTSGAWYWANEVTDLSFKFDNDAQKSDFISKYGNITVNYGLANNVWVSGPKGWKYSGGKHSDIHMKTSQFKLTGSNNTYTFHSFTDDNHGQREWTEIQFKEIWDGNVLKLNRCHGASVWWMGGSVYDHAAIVKTKNVSFTFSDGLSKKKFGTKSNISALATGGVGNWKILDGAQNSAKDIKKDDSVKNAVMLMTNHLFISTSAYTIGNTLYVNISLIEIFMGFGSYYALDLTMLANVDHFMMGDLSVVINPGETHAMYSNKYTGASQSTNSLPANGIDKMPKAWVGMDNIIYLYDQN